MKTFEEVWADAKARQDALDRQHRRVVELENENYNLKQKIQHLEKGSEKPEDFRTVTITRARLNELETTIMNAEKERNEYYLAGLRQAEELNNTRGLLHRWQAEWSKQKTSLTAVFDDTIEKDTKDYFDSLPEDFRLSFTIDAWERIRLELEELRGWARRFKERYNALPAIPNVQQWHGLAVQTMADIEGWVKVGEHGLAEKETEETRTSEESADGERADMPVTEAEVILALKGVQQGVLRLTIRYLQEARRFESLQHVLELELMRRGEKL